MILALELCLPKAKIHIFNGNSKKTILFWN